MTIYDDAPFNNYWMYITLMKEFHISTIKEVKQMPMSIAYGVYDSLLKAEAEHKKK